MFIKSHLQNVFFKSWNLFLESSKKGFFCDWFLPEKFLECIFAIGSY